MSVTHLHVNMCALIPLIVLCAPVMLDFHLTVTEELAGVSDYIVNKMSIIIICNMQMLTSALHLLVSTPAQILPVLSSAPAEMDIS